MSDTAPIVIAHVDQASQTPMPARRSPWLVSAGFDLIMVCNLYWVVVLACSLAGASFLKAIDFWMVYLLITPHRWITLILIFGDHDRYAERPRAFLGLAIGLTIAIAACTVAVPTLTLLLVIDFFWNSWHFAAQHTGIARIYSRLARPTETTWVQTEKYLLRTFFLYVLIRLGAPLMAADRSQWLGWLDAVVPVMTHLDMPMLAIPFVFLAKEIAFFRSQSIGRLAYLGSVLTLYSGTLIAAHWSDYIAGPPAVLSGFLLSVTAFHSLEYFAIVTWSVRKRYANPTVGSGPMKKWAKRWWLFLLVFVGSLGLGAFMIEKQFIREWFLINLLVSFLHYAYDGLIWKQRPPQPTR